LAGNPGFSRIRLRLQTPGLAKLREKSPKVSTQIRKYSRFAETIGGDWFDHHCRSGPIVQFCVPIVTTFEIRDDLDYFKTGTVTLSRVLEDEYPGSRPTVDVSKLA
jgi:hypothetical protein